MLYQRSLEIEQRLDAVLRLIHTGNYSTPTLATEVGVSIPTISRCVTALRARGHNIQAEKFENGWRYFLKTDPALETECQPKRPPRKAR
jgi:transposase